MLLNSCMIILILTNLVIILLKNSKIISGFLIAALFMRYTIFFIVTNTTLSFVYIVCGLGALFHIYWFCNISKHHLFRVLLSKIIYILLLIPGVAKTYSNLTILNIVFILTCLCLIIYTIKELTSEYDNLIKGEIIIITKELAPLYLIISPFLRLSSNL